MLIHAIVTTALLLPAVAQAESQQFTILHTNDWQSRLLGFGPNAEYTPLTTDDDRTLGGIARLAALINTRRTAAEARGPVLVLDGGDFTMGTLFHTITQQTGLEIQLLAKLGYDAAVIGNHEFDFGPGGLAAMINAAAQKVDDLPPLLLSNVQFDPTDPRDDDLAELADKDVIRDTVIIEQGGLRFGLFGLMGVDAIAVSTQLAPLTFVDPLEAASRWAITLKEQHHVDVVILLSHGGVRPDGTGTWQGEDVAMMKQTPQIDIIVGGHSHTALTEPILVDGHRPVLQAGSDGKFLGELVMQKTAEGLEVVSYALHAIDDKIAGDTGVNSHVDAHREQIDTAFLNPIGYRFDETVGEVSRSLSRDYDDYVLGNLVTDAIRKAAGAHVGLASNGTIRDDLHYGTSGIQRVSDIFRIAPLGGGYHDELPGYPLATFYLQGHELKALCEVLLLAYGLRGDSYYPRVSGIQIRHNPYRVPFDRVESIAVGNPSEGYREIDLGSDNETLYSIAATTYVASFTWLIEDISKGILSVTPKTKDGKRINDVKDVIVDGDPTKPGVQEIKEWWALTNYIRNLKDTDNDGIPNISDDANANERRIIERPSLKPVDLYRNATYIMWVATGILGLVLVALGWLVRRILFGRKRRKRINRLTLPKQ